MLTLEQIYQGADRFISDLLRAEAELQGHTLSGTMAASFKTEQKVVRGARVMEGTAIKYTDYVNDGFPAKSASMRQFPFVKQFFIDRGVPEDEAGGAAAATIRKWMKEGMSTQASKRFSKTGARQNMIESAFVGGDTKIDEFMNRGFDQSIEEHYRITKTETI